MINMFLLNLMLMFVYAVLTDSFSFLNLLVGFAIGFIVAAIYAAAAGQPNYPLKGWKLLRFACYFTYILVKANLEVAWEVMTPGFKMTPRLIKYPVQGMTDVEITALANAITLTPGTLTTDVDEAGDYLYIHCMYAQNREDAVKGLDELKHMLLKEVFGK